MDELILEAADEAATERIGAALAALLPAGAVVALHGTLGAGKTRLVQAIAAASGIERAEVVSPTFVLLATYRGRRTIHHLDAYRLRDEDDFREIGGDEILASGDLVFIEWAEKIAAALPADRLDLILEVTGPTTRRICFRTSNEHIQRCLNELVQLGS
ncbi:MAG: tRNA (adenosine(37)-N6)-threonylcarbamoyltransferase complex ATPase subunit type 1 TsaE [Pirellulaceae bacterium]|nr:tRNA (adenosine(37)-N6)-threonylcarbamoyltransferase complex ATPase subunit type 1 TsaE [Pirellulaceae bacterium]